MNIILTSDDCGLSQAINEKTLDLYQQGIITCAAVITNTEAASHASKIFRETDIEIGVHLNLTTGQPLTSLASDSPLLASDGTFLSLYKLLLNGYFPSPRFLADAEDEFRAQIQFLLDTGCNITNLSTHFHFHSIPALREIVWRLAGEYAVEWVRSTRWTGHLTPNNPLLLFRQEPVQHTFTIPDYFVPLMSWRDKNATQLIDALARRSGLFELAVHVFPERPVSINYPVSYGIEKRIEETKFLMAFWEQLQATEY